jgi:hypothetical protein
MRTTSHRTWIVLGAMLLTSRLPAAEGFGELLRRVPGQANALLLIDVDAAHRSPQGAKEGWARNHERDALGGIESLPPAVERLVVAAHINPTTLDPVWRVGIAATRSAVTPTQIAAAENGSIDSVAGLQVVLSPRNTYYAVLRPQTVGAMSPPNRQEFSRWVRATGGPTPYLTDAAAAATAPVFLALDTTDVFDPPGLRARLNQSKAMAGHTADLDRVIGALASLKGIRLSVQVAPALSGEMRLDCDGAEVLVPVAKALVLEALAATGSAVEDLEGWTARSSGPAVVLSGPLTERGLRQLVSPLLSPAVTAAHNGPAPGSPGKPTAAASQRYFQSVSKLLKELRAQKTQTYNNLSRMYQTYAQQIDELPLLGVDPELQTYAMQVSITLRNLGTLGKATLNQNRMLSMQRSDAAVQVGGSTPTVGYGGYGGNYGGYGGYGWGYGSVPTTSTMDVSNREQINSLIAQSGANEQVIRSQTWNNFDKATAEIRRKMITKYQVEF